MQTRYYQNNISLTNLRVCIIICVNLQEINSYKIHLTYKCLGRFVHINRFCISFNTKHIFETYLLNNIGT